MDHSFIISLGLIFSSSLAGSFHCGAMCGSFSCLASKGNYYSKITINQTAYHLGRLCTYLILSIIFYYSSNLLGTFTNSTILKNAILLSCIFLLALDLIKEIPFLNYGNKLISIGTKNSILDKILASAAGTLGRIMKLQQDNNFGAHNFLLGFSTGLIPCGWLYMYIALAGTQDSLLKTLLSIFSFWMGTIPILIIIGFFGSRLSTSIFPKIKYISRALLICAAIISINARAPFLTFRNELDCSFCFGNYPNSNTETND